LEEIISGFRMWFFLFNPLFAGNSKWEPILPLYVLALGKSKTIVINFMLMILVCNNKQFEVQIRHTQKFLQVHLTLAYYDA
jgi:hypothetical protein